MILFAFDIYDQDKSGYIDLKEAQSLVKDVYGQKYELNVHAKRYIPCGLMTYLVTEFPLN